MTIMTNKKKVTTSHFHLFSFFYHLSNLLFFSIIFVFGGYFSLSATYFCCTFLFDECFTFRSTFVIWRDWLDRGFFLRSGVRCIFYFHMFFSFGWCFAVRFFSTFTNTMKVTTSHFHYFHFFTIFSYLFWRDVGSLFLSQSFFITFTNKKHVTSSHLFSFFYHLLRYTFFLSFLCFVDIFLLELLIFVIFFCLMNVLLSDLLLLYDEIGWIEVFFSDMVFNVYFVFICSFLLVDVLLWYFSAPLQIQRR